MSEGERNLFKEAALTHLCSPGNGTRFLIYKENLAEWGLSLAQSQFRFDLLMQLVISVVLLLVAATVGGGGHTWIAYVPLCLSLYCFECGFDIALAWRKAKREYLPSAKAKELEP